MASSYNCKTLTSRIEIVSESDFSPSLLLLEEWDFLASSFTILDKAFYFCLFHMRHLLSLWPPSSLVTFAELVLDTVASIL